MAFPAGVNAAAVGGPGETAPSHGVPDVLAAIDIGTNSIHMVVARVSGRGFEIITREKELVRLGRGSGEMKRLTPEAMDRGVAALARCRKIANNWNAEIVAVATSAVREALNGPDFIERAEEEAGVEVQVISGIEEARLIHLGVLQALAVYDETILCCDIGGGSTELLFGKGEEVLTSRSLKVGAIRITERCFSRGVTPAAVSEAKRYLRDLFAAFAHETQAIRPAIMVGSSGTIETVVRMALARGGQSVPRSLNATEITRDDVRAVVEELVAAGTPPAICALPGSDSSRADILVGGALILLMAMKVFDVRRLVFSDGSLREGVLLDAMELFSGSRRHLGDIRRQSVLHLVELCEDDPDHALNVARLADQLLWGLRGSLGLPDHAGELLEAAALLCNVGLFISHNRHHQHSYYVIRNAESLTGFTQREIEVIAQVARYHRKSAPSTRHAEFAALGPEDRHLVSNLAAILRVAVGLDRSHQALVEDLTVTVGADTILIVAQPVQVDGRPADLELEMEAARRRSELLAEVSGRSVTIEATGSVGAG
jgi:exopolyphosphatase/guanosine-5'-triphosphate,3'-diphosphate pyrophosphatase